MQIVTYSETRLVKRHRGTMPIILTCPHGGSETPPNVSRRTAATTPATCTGGNAFKDSRDANTIDVAEGVAQKILDLTGLSPYVVIAEFHRERIDANRPDRCAFTDPDAQPFYDEYHNRIADYLDQLLAENDNRGFLFDIHGTGNADADIFLGTGNGATLSPGFDRKNLFMQHGLQGLLTAVRQPNGALPPATLRYTLSPADATEAEVPELNGGFTVRTNASRLNCIQLEITSSIRNDDARRALLVEALAFTLINFVRRYAPF